MGRVALYLQDAHELRDGLDYVRYAEQRGFEAVWQAESRLVRDAIGPMAAHAAGGGPRAKNVGTERRKPLLAMRETVELLRRLLRLERVTFHGEFHWVDGIE